MKLQPRSLAPEADRINIPPRRERPFPEEPDARGGRRDPLCGSLWATPLVSSPTGIPRRFALCRRAPKSAASGFVSRTPLSGTGAPFRGAAVPAAFAGGAVARIAKASAARESPSRDRDLALRPPTQSPPRARPSKPSLRTVPPGEPPACAALASFAVGATTLADRRRLTPWAAAARLTGLRRNRPAFRVIHRTQSTIRR